MLRFLIFSPLIGWGSILSGCFLFGGDDDQPIPISPIEQLPPITSEGKGTFGCLINGRVYANRYPKAIASFSVVDVISIGSDFDDDNSSLSLQISDYSREPIRYDYPQATMQYFLLNDSTDCGYRVNDILSGYIEIIEHDPFNPFVSGTFEFTSVNERCDTLRIMNGRFDLKTTR